MVRTKYFVIDILMEEERCSRGRATAQEIEEYRAKLERTLGYGDLGRIALGKWCAYLIDFAVWFTQFLTIVAYFIFLANTIYSLYPVRPAAIPLNSSNYEDLGLVGDVCPRDNPEWGFYSTKTEVGVPMLNIPNIRNSHEDCATSSEFTRRKRSAFQMTSKALPDDGDTNLELSSDNLEESFFHDNVEPDDERNNETEVPVISTTPNTTIAPDTTTGPPPTSPLYFKSMAPDMKLLFFIPLPFFLCTSLIRELRILSPLTVVATFALFVGAFSVLGFELSGEVSLNLFQIEVPGRMNGLLRCAVLVK